MRRALTTLLVPLLLSAGSAWAANPLHLDCRGSMFVYREQSWEPAATASPNDDHQLIVTLDGPRRTATFKTLRFGLATIGITEKDFAYEGSMPIDRIVGGVPIRSLDFYLNRSTSDVWVSVSRAGETKPGWSLFLGKCRELQLKF